MSLNVHHLELFYFVAKFEGITEAVRKMPYGIQQPAVSGQISQLEKSLGLKLFHRRPFALTPAGEELYDYVYPFFSQLDQVGGRLRGEETQHLRLAASAAVLRNHLPQVLQAVRSDFPDLRLTLREVKSTEIEAALQKQEADVAVTILHRKTAPGLTSIKLLELPQVLLVPKNAPITKFREVVAKAEGPLISQPLITLPPNEQLSLLFQAGLKKRDLQWDPSMEVSEVGLIERYVSDGFGYGITLNIPGIAWPKTVRAIRLPAADFAPVVVGVLHMGNLKAVGNRFVKVAQAYAKELMKAA
ncbi:MAG: LysR family transcriptional regulator [Verrucomicrobiales bacterium]|nr:LysR family transcriptional regulator [Verrucomicrobiales bacterium]